MINESNYVETAEKVILELKEMRNEKTGKTIPMVTTSKIRNLLAMTAEIYNDVVNDASESLSEEVCSRIEYLKIRFVYESGREPAVKKFVEKAQILGCLSSIRGKRRNYLLFSRYMEALIAYHRYYGGKEQ